jgi:hypothetical protein
MKLKGGSMITEKDVTIKVPEGYELLVEAIEDALDRAARGKGRKRHADYDNQPLEQQDIYRYSHVWRLDQIVKKTKEVPRLRKRDRLGELADVIVLAAVEIKVVKDELKKEVAKRH